MTGEPPELGTAKTSELADVLEVSLKFCEGPPAHTTLPVASLQVQLQSPVQALLVLSSLCLKVLRHCGGGRNKTSP